MKVTVPVAAVVVVLVSAFPDRTPAVEAAGKDDTAWIDAMRQVHARFKGKPGTLAHFGDSITVTMAYWTPLSYAAKNLSPEVGKALDRVKARLVKECWRDWKGPKFGSEGGMTIRWAAENVDRWLRELDPECALVMFGTNDLGALELDEYRTKTREVVRKCLDHGTVVILSTIPPRHGLEEKAKTFAEAVRGIAREMKVPLIDFHAEVLKRRPDDWDGALEKFKEWKDYDVPTLISRDGVHPSYPTKWADDYSEEGLRSSGYVLRSFLSLRAYARVLDEVLERRPDPGR